MAKHTNQSKGRGWYGDSEGHARAGRKGGRASRGGKNRRGNNTNSSTADHYSS